MIVYISESMPWLIVVVVLMLLVGIILLIKYVFNPFFVSMLTSLLIQERLEILHKEGCLYKRHRFLTKKEIVTSPFSEKNLLDMVFWSERQGFVEAIDTTSNQLCYYWIQVRRPLSFFPFTTKQITIVKEVDLDTITFYKNWTESELVVFDAHCPACGAAIQKNDVKCPDCDLALG